ncbi:MAG: hypothetical protein AB7F79_00120 [Steroidobacteraceae bacterium]
MEIFLLLLDEIDDATAVLRGYMPRLMGLLLACGLLAVSVWSFMRWPWLVAGLLLVALLLSTISMLRLKSLPRLKTDP